MEQSILQALEQMEGRIIRHVDQRIDDLRTELKAEINDLRTEVNDLRTELKAEINDLRTEVNDLRTEMNRRFDDIEEKQTELIAIYTEKQAIKLSVIQLEFEALTKRVEKQELITKHLL
ncbi:hypothetical protein BG53_00890 [Paenibacillus darwinianus]|uniref:Uncharacterized protein n=1 Tax=Paenibacillus darwinianus TaxID=1380763 RepID=A0A9W5S161_9BACL|nr:hypothetical protein [Paenibacillus darwinianus]EXX88227.1 hypothetical protein CH50_03770 [Paenibacillus darwinianus]EXX89002.1 hypothetical protein BG53_00890 [Paenibacillus darwinianus]EXX89423.1 hypothetical protein BG52_15550 [Paenibacillus darwinianus]